MSTSKFVNPTKVITGICTFSYLNCWEPKAIEGGKPKFSVSLVIPKSDTKTVERIRAAIQAAYEEGASKLKGNGKSVPALTAIRTPLRDLQGLLFHQRKLRHCARHRRRRSPAHPHPL